MKSEAKKTIEKELRDLSMNGKVDEQETIAVLDAIMGVWLKAGGEERPNDIYEKVMFSMPAYSELFDEDEKADIASYYSTFPKELIKGFKMDGSAEEILTDLIALTVDKAVEKGYKESKNITISDKATYRAEMEKYWEEKEASAGMREMIVKMGGQAGLEALGQHLKTLAKRAISSQRKYFFDAVDNVVKMHAKIEIASRESAENEADEAQSA